MTETITPEQLYQAGVERYQAGEPPEVLIPVFKEICERASKNSNAWTSLAWLYLLDNKPAPAYKAAKKAVKLNPHDPQALINLVIAMLETNQTGVRPHVEKAQQLLMASSEWAEEVQKNFEDGLKRKPDWKSLNRVKSWLE